MVYSLPYAPYITRMYKQTCLDQILVCSYIHSFKDDGKMSSIGTTFESTCSQMICSHTSDNLSPERFRVVYVAVNCIHAGQKISSAPTVVNMASYPAHFYEFEKNKTSESLVFIWEKQQENLQPVLVLFYFKKV